MSDLYTHVQRTGSAEKDSSKEHLPIWPNPTYITEVLRVLFEEDNAYSSLTWPRLGTPSSHAWSRLTRVGSGWYCASIVAVRACLNCFAAELSGRVGWGGTVAALAVCREPFSVSLT